MATQKEIQSAINVLNARLEQVKTSALFSEEERIPLVEKIQDKLAKLKPLLEIKESDNDKIN